MHFKVGPVQSRLLDFLLAALEVIRRGHWNFYRCILSHLKELNGFILSFRISLLNSYISFDNILKN